LIGLIVKPYAPLAGNRCRRAMKNRIGQGRKVRGRRWFLCGRGFSVSWAKGRTLLKRPPDRMCCYTAISCTVFRGKVNFNWASQEAPRALLKQTGEGNTSSWTLLLSANHVPRKRGWRVALSGPLIAWGSAGRRGSELDGWIAIKTPRGSG